VCGRFVSSSSATKIAEFFGASFDAEPLAPSFNVAPTNEVYAVVANSGGDRHLTTYRWGLVPSWAKDVKIGARMINARAETLAAKPAFKRLFRNHRLLLPMDGFYEWQAASAPAGAKPLKQPMYIHRTDGQPLAVAGLWAAWRDPGADAETPWLHTCTVVTTAANATIAPVHDRMPVVLAEDVWARWLDPTFSDLDALQPMLVPAPDHLFTVHPVSSAVNNVRNKGHELIDPAPEHAPQGHVGRLL
jgi:putative SOS response-associated peptidase YedK